MRGAQQTIQSCALTSAPKRPFSDGFLGDSADNPRYIETLARRGYRLMLPIQYLESAPETALEKDRERREQSAAEMSENTARVQRQIKPHWWKAALVLVSAVILVGAGYVSWQHFRATRPPT